MKQIYIKFMEVHNKPNGCLYWNGYTIHPLRISSAIFYLRSFSHFLPNVILYEYISSRSQHKTSKQDLGLNCIVDHIKFIKFRSISKISMWHSLRSRYVVFTIHSHCVIASHQYQGSPFVFIVFIIIIVVDSNIY